MNVLIEHFIKIAILVIFCGFLDENKVLFILMKCVTKNTSKIVNRIRSAINKQLLKRKLPSISIIYGNIIQKHSVKNA
ncbi:hypothetical protein wTpre_139 [Wolbachia endosymbiont of Trichogramma pretiosum]|nr:hypothetical protein wTpre_139 [Wolbachia endosymbiont of Trichogramma pretiosum]